MKKKILFISSTNLTTNPRLLKELKTAVNNDYEVDFYGFYLNNWSDKIDKNIQEQINANFFYIHATKKGGFSWFISSIIEKIAKKTYSFFPNNLKINAFAHSKRSLLLWQKLKKNNKKYNFIVAHTLPTLYPAYKLAKKTNTKFIFDIEDYHPGEIITSDIKKETSRRIFLMKKLLPMADFITYASPLIGEYSLKLLNNYPTNQHLLINNCFSETEFIFKENNSEKIKFVWFSQNIAAGRGLELAIPVLYKFKEKIELHLIGNLYTNYFDDFLYKYAEIISIHKPLSQEELNKKISDFDIGLAIEISKIDINKDIAISNKIWAYFQSGLYILATDTSAQNYFISQHKNSGVITKQNSASFEKNVKKILLNIQAIRNTKKQRFEHAKEFSWENEQQKLLKIWKNL